MSDHLGSMHLHSGDKSSLTLIQCPCRRPVSEKRTVSNYVLTVPEPPWDLGDLEYPYQPSFQLDPRVLVVPWGHLGLELQEDLLHLCIHVEPMVHEVPLFPGDPAAPAGPAGPGIPGMPGIPAPPRTRSVFAGAIF